MTKPVVGDKIATWFSDRPDGLSTILEVKPYYGRYDFDTVIRVTAPRTYRGWMEMAIRSHDYTATISQR